MYILHPQENNKLSVSFPVQGISIDFVIENAIPKNTPYKIMELLNIDDDFFDAYEFDSELGSKLNADKAKELHKDKWRSARKPKLEALDIAFMKAVESGDTAKQSEIAAEKQALRDVTNTPIIGSTIEEIKSVWPEILN